MMTLNKKSPLDMGINETEEDNTTEINKKIYEIINNIENIEDKDINLVIEKTTKKLKKEKPPKTTKKCKICNEEKPIEEFVINKTVEINRKVYFKSKCLDCYKKISKEYYEKNLKNNKIRYHKKKNFTVKIKYSNLEELEQEYKKLREKFLLENQILLVDDPLKQ